MQIRLRPLVKVFPIVSDFPVEQPLKGLARPERDDDAVRVAAVRAQCHEVVAADADAVPDDQRLENIQIRVNKCTLCRNLFYFTCCGTEVGADHNTTDQRL